MKKFLLTCFYCASLFSSDLVDDYLARLENLDVPHKDELILLSGTPGMGRTTLAKRLAQDLKGVYISADELRQLSEKKNVKKEVYTLFKRIRKEHQNHRIIFDGGLTLVHHLALLSQEMKGKKPDRFVTGKKVVIRMSAPREHVEGRIRKCKVNPDAYFKHLDKWFQIYDESAVYPFDHYFDNRNGNFELAYRKLFQEYLQNRNVSNGDAS